MDIESIGAALTVLEEGLSKFGAEMSPIRPSWNKINFSCGGVAAIFEEHKRVAGWSDFIGDRLCFFELRRSEIVVGLEELQAQQNRKSSSELQTNMGKWVSQGFAASEREMLSKLVLGDDAVNMHKMLLRVKLLDGQISVLKAKLKQLAEFRQDSRLVERFLNLGHILQEL